MNIDNLITKISQEGAKKPLPNPMKVTVKWLLLMVLYFVVLASFSGLRPDILVKLLQPLFLFELVMILTLGVVCAYVASVLALPDSAQKPWIRFVPFVFLTCLLAILAYQIWTTKTLPLADCLKLGNYQCIMHIIFYAIMPAIVMFVMIKKAAPIKCCWLGSVVGLCVASFSYAMMRLVEASDDPSTLAVWHLVPVFLMIAGGVMIGEMVFGKIWKRTP